MGLRERFWLKLFSYRPASGFLRERFFFFWSVSSSPFQARLTRRNRWVEYDKAYRNKAIWRKMRGLYALPHDASLTSTAPIHLNFMSILDGQCARKLHSRRSILLRGIDDGGRQLRGLRRLQFESMTVDARESKVPPVVLLFEQWDTGPREW